MTLSSERLQSLGIELLREAVGKGGSATVHHCRVVAQLHPELPPLGTDVALKEFHPSVLTIPGQRLRIQQEADLGTNLQSPHLCRTYLGAVEDDQAYIVMEWIEGETLGDWSRDLRKNAAWDRLKTVALDLVSAVSVLHEAGVLHRDIKPENVMVVSDRAKLMDVGVAEISSDSEHTMHTAVKDFVGSVRYASPQFIKGEDFDKRDDVYSIGATFFELFSGEPPYAGVERKPVLPIEVVLGPPMLGPLRQNVPKYLSLLIQGCLHPDRQRRPSLEEIKQVFEEGESSAYLAKEVERRNTESRGYEVLRVDHLTGGFFADVGQDQPRLSEEYTVVRRANELEVPSLGGARVKPEIWVASAELRHVHNNVGHFKLLDKVWVQNRSRYSLADVFGQGGHWKDVDKKSLDIVPGDFVIRSDHR